MPKIYDKIDLTEKNKTKRKKNSSGSTAAKSSRTAKKTEKKAAEKKTASAAASSAKKTDTAKKASKKNVPASPKPATKSRQKKIQSDEPLRIISLGGLEEIGKNMTLFICGDDAVIVDCGMAFPDDDLLGVDTVIPDFTYLESIKDKLRGLVVTHGHEDHIGGIPFLLQQFRLPIYATPLTIGLISSKISETGISATDLLNTVHTGDTVHLGCFSIEFIRVNHSIPDSAALAITTPAGVIMHTGDFKIDYTPVFEETADLGRLSEYGEKGVLALLCDSTNAERPGNSLSESNVGSSFEALFSRAEGKRVIIATFSSNIQRLQQIIDFAENHGRKIAVSGRSMLSNVEIAQQLGYLRFRDGTMIDVESVNSYRPEDLVIITTGSQGEPMSALSRMAAGEHRQIKITSKDFIIISATPIPGNEKAVTRVINSLLKLGSDVIYESMYEVHASGHACQNEIKLMISLVRPKYFFPVHGEYKHLIANRSTAVSMGIPERNVILSEIGKVVEFSHGKASFNGTVDSGRVLVDGYGIGDVGAAVLRERKRLSSDGLVFVVCGIENGSGDIVSGPEVISRGFVYVRDSEELMNDIRNRTMELLESFRSSRRYRRGEMQEVIRAELGRLLYQKTKKSPMIIPVILDI